MLPNYEKLGAFYLGRSQADNNLLLYDSADLMTHAVCVGMTGSGKTGLCIGLLEEAAIDGIPAIVIDPKGDLGNLLLTFPELRGEDFAPWVNDDEARNKGIEPAVFAGQQAELWKKGLASWEQDGDRIQRLKDAADFAIYTPGSDAGIPISIMSSFAAPPSVILDDREALLDRINATATSLLGLVGIDADPVRSREHVLLANILDTNWRAGQDLDLPALIAQIQTPPTQKIGVMELESFYPAKERFGLAMALNGLLASPGFEMWLKGEELDVDRLLWTSTGKPRVSIISIAHLSEAERMFFVSLLLNQVLSWVRGQTGTTSLRALLYMDEIFGYFPPVANPPSKKPLLTLLKQARAYGLGVVLATQNPSDLDYKGLSNTGTWFLGRLQTERDKARVLEGLEGASLQAGSQFDRASMDKLLAGLGKRVFLMNNVHEKEPVLFETRWVMSYLRGPIARADIQRLMQERKDGASDTKVDSSGATVKACAPVLPPSIPQYFLPVRDTGNLAYTPVIVASAKVHFNDARKDVDDTKQLTFTVPMDEQSTRIDWDLAEECECGVDDLEATAEPDLGFAELPSAAANPKSYAAWSKGFATWLYRTQKMELLQSASLKEMSAPGESERDFRIRLQQSAREERDRLKATLRDKFEPKLERLEQRKRKAEQKVEVQESQSSGQILNTVVHAGAGILGALLGRKVTATKIGTTLRSAGRVAKERGDVGRAEEDVAAVDKQIAELNAEFEADVAALAEQIDPSTEAFETVSVRPKKSDITVELLGLCWRAGA